MQRFKGNFSVFSEKYFSGNSPRLYGIRSVAPNGRSIRYRTRSFIEKSKIVKNLLPVPYVVNFNPLKKQVGATLADSDFLSYRSAQRQRPQALHIGIDKSAPYFVTWIELHPASNTAERILYGKYYSKSVRERQWFLWRIVPNFNFFSAFGENSSDRIDNAADLRYNCFEFTSAIRAAERGGYHGINGAR